jgi:hypothetical protein
MARNAMITNSTAVLVALVLNRLVLLAKPEFDTVVMINPLNNSHIYRQLTKIISFKKKGLQQKLQAQGGGIKICNT